MTPKVFVSHASEDKDRFVLNFAKRLRTDYGIDAWVDKWEMLPGDSLVDKIFSEGLKEAQAIIIVLSKNSINKPWVKEEINASFVKRVSGGCKLIPVVLDNCEVPECLQSTVWQPINDVDNYDDELSRIVHAIYGTTDKPLIGQQPRYVSSVIDVYPSLTKTDSIIFNSSCELAISKNSIYQIGRDNILNKVKQYDINMAELNESLDILDRHGYIKAFKVMSGAIPVFNITTFGMGQYIRQNVSDFDGIIKAVSYKILNESKGNLEIAEDLGIPIVLINQVYYFLQSKGLMKLTETLTGGILIRDVSPEFRRWLEQIK